MPSEESATVHGCILGNVVLGRENKRESTNNAETLREKVCRGSVAMLCRFYTTNPRRRHDG